MQVPLRLSHNIIVPSLDPLTINLLSEENAAELTSLGCPLRILRHRPDYISQTLTLLSDEPVTINYPSEEKSILLTLPVCPLNSFLC